MKEKKVNQSSEGMKKELHPLGCSDRVEESSN